MVLIIRGKLIFLAIVIVLFLFVIRLLFFGIVGILVFCMVFLVVDLFFMVLIFFGDGLIKVMLWLV